MHLPNSDFKRMLETVSAEFRKRKCVQEVSAELTTKPFVIDGVECQMVCEVKVYPVATGNVVSMQKAKR